MSPSERRQEMVRRQLVARGIRDARVLEAMGEVPRESFLPPALAEFAYDDARLPLPGGGASPAPYFVARAIEALALEGGERVLEIGTGTGYAAAVLGRIAGEVYTVEDDAAAAERADAALRRDGCTNVHVLRDAGNRGWEAQGPFDAILVSAAGPDIPPALRRQLAPGGRVAMAVGADPRTQTLVRELRMADGRVLRSELGRARLVPPIGADEWAAPGVPPLSHPAPAEEREARERADLARLVGAGAEPLGDVADPALDALVDRLGDARVVLLGVPTCGSSEPFALRARLTRALIERRGFHLVAAAADAPDAAHVDATVRGRIVPDAAWAPFSRFPTWIWRNREFADFVGRLRDLNVRRPAGARVGFHGLDLYGGHRTLDVVLAQLDRVDPQAANVARARYAGLGPFESDPVLDERASLSSSSAALSRENGVVDTLREILARRLDRAESRGAGYFDGAHRAALVSAASDYYRAAYRGGLEAWNLRARHLFDTLRRLRACSPPEARVVVWAHDRQVGDARATEAWARGAESLGHLCRETWGDDVRLVGFGTDRGRVAAAEEWGAPMRRMDLPRAQGGYERIFRDAGCPGFVLELRAPERPELRARLAPPRRLRTIGPIYRPDRDAGDRALQVSLPHAFDAFVWLEETHAIEPLGGHVPSGLPETHPFGI